jgi:hypothetical protein|tara:strand:+ start:283 stop:528 length:246 start_codon:yes stop_codon:yes gene_type:complete
MHNYKALKSAGKVSVRKQDNGELQVVKKVYSSDTGEAQDDSVKSYSLKMLGESIDNCKAQVTKIQFDQADLEQLETDLKAL